MKETELRNQLQGIYGNPPPATHQAFVCALSSPSAHERRKTMRKKIAALPLLAVLMVLLVGCTAYAAVSQVMSWYYSNRDTHLKELYPERYEALMNHILTDLPQQQSDDPWVTVQIPEAVWLPEENRLILAVTAAPKDGKAVELHPMWNLDADGSYAGGDFAPGTPGEDSEDRGDHWLWTEKGYGPVRQMMSAPEKALVLIDAYEISLGAADAPQQHVYLNMDALDMSDGEVLFMLEGQLDPDIMRAYRTAEGWEIPLTLLYTVHPYEDGMDDMTLYTGITGSVTLTLRVKEENQSE